MNHQTIDEKMEKWRQENEASVLTSAPELDSALVVPSGSLEIDVGKISSLEHTTLVLGVRERATKAFNSL